MFDMIALAFQANLTRIASYMMAAEVSNQPYNFIGVSDAFHPLSHHQNNAQKMDRLARVQTFNTEMFARFVKRLSELPDGDGGTMLDTSIVLFGSNMSNSNLHDHFPLPTAVIGRGNGRLKGGQHVKYDDRTPIANLHYTLLDRVGIPMDKLGDSSGEARGDLTMRRGVYTAALLLAACALPGLAATDTSTPAPTVNATPAAGAAAASEATVTLLEATKSQQRDLAIRLLAQKADPNQAGADGTTPLHWAAHFADADLVKRLLRAGAAAGARNEFGATPMSEAAERADAEILKALLAAGATWSHPTARARPRS